MKYSWTSRKRPSEMSSLGGGLRELRQYWVKILPHFHKMTEETYPCFKCVIHVKNSILRKKPGTSHWETSVSCTIQEDDNVTTPYYPTAIICPHNFKFLALKVVAVISEGWSLTRGFKYSDLTWKILVFWKTGRWGEVVATGDSTVSIKSQFPESARVLTLKSNKVFKRTTQIYIKHYDK